MEPGEVLAARGGGKATTKDNPSRQATTEGQGRRRGTRDRRSPQALTDFSVSGVIKHCKDDLPEDRFMAVKMIVHAYNFSPPLTSGVRRKLISHNLFLILP
ncbi:hypothetical protein V6N11_009295 [Hibiscus sabdariffa]|uniref:Uncharacterized protein n=1 Tax=Hibiscus sabdariffa TaxID=183260 RepID=A0ABR2PQJ9_9ROSI